MGYNEIAGWCGWRVIYRYTEENKLEVLLVLEIGDRGDIYK